jgi:hypothetical protein
MSRMKTFQLSFPKNLAEQYSRGTREGYNSYAFSYVRANNPAFKIVRTINGNKQDPFEQGYVIAVRKNKGE